MIGGILGSCLYRGLAKSSILAQVRAKVGGHGDFRKSHRKGGGARIVFRVMCQDGMHFFYWRPGRKSGDQSPLDELRVGKATTNCSQAA